LCPFFIGHNTPKSNTFSRSTRDLSQKFPINKGNILLRGGKGQTYSFELRKRNHFQTNENMEDKELAVYLILVL